MIVALLFLVAVVDFAMSMVVLRADRKRWDNRIFAAMGILEGFTHAVRGVLVFEGHDLMERSVQVYGVVHSVFITYLLLVFAYSFPFNRVPSRRWFVGHAIAPVAVLGLIATPATREWICDVATFAFFLPFFLLTMRHLQRNLQRASVSKERVGVPLIQIALAFRWIVALTTYGVARNIDPALFSAFVYFDATGAVLAGTVLMGYGILRQHHFRVRGAMAEVLLWSFVGAGFAGFLAGTADYVLRNVADDSQPRALLVPVALAPVVLIGLLSWSWPRIERVLLGWLDPLRDARREVLTRVLAETAREVDPAAVLARIRAAITEVTGGAEVRFLRVQAGGSSLDAGEEPASAGRDIRVPVRRGRTLYGVLTIEGGAVDRDALQVAVALADHLALKLENFGLFTEIDETRRLAALGSFAAAIAHEIRTPLTSIQMNVQMLKAKATVPPAYEECFDITLEELGRLNRHVSEILDYAKPVQLAAVPVDLREIADETTRGMEPLLARRRVRVEREHAPDLPQVAVDAQRIRQVLVNLLDNAANASPEGGSIVVKTARSTDGRVSLEVVDRGRGIQTADLPRVFEPFFTTRPDGTGLGLAIAQKIVKAHGGEIRVASIPGAGATFTVLLPAELAA